MKKQDNAVLRILIVEDQPSDMYSPSVLSHHLGFEVTLAFDGEQGLVEAVKSDYNLVILDWNMPVMSGEKFLYHLERRNNLKSKNKINIILHTGENFSVETFGEADNFRVLDVWRKPLNPIEMLKRIKHIRETVRC